MKDEIEKKKIEYKEKFEGIFKQKAVDVIVNINTSIMLLMNLHLCSKETKSYLHYLHVNTINSRTKKKE